MKDTILLVICFSNVKSVLYKCSKVDSISSLCASIEAYYSHSRFKCFAILIENIFFPTNPINNRDYKKDNGKIAYSILFLPSWINTLFR